MYRDNFKKLYDTGVRVTTGTDMVLPGLLALPVAREAAYMVELGITPLQAIEAAISNCATALHLEDTIGKIAEGYLADLVIVQGETTQNITVLEQVEAVYQEGVLVN